jgi:AraC-like DNA-binding protein
MDNPESCRGIPRYLRAAHYDRSVASAPTPSRRIPPPFSLRFIEVKRIRVKSDVHFMEHRHEFFELFIPERGVYECTLNGCEHKLRAGELIFIQPGDMHSDHYIQGTCFLIIQYEALDLEGRRIKEGVFADDAPCEDRKLSAPTGSRLALLLDSLGRPGDPKQEDLRTLEPLCQALFWEILAQIPEPDLSAKFRSRRSGDSFKLKALELFASTPARDFDANELALALGMSRRAMESRFKDFFSSSPAHAFMAFKSAEAAKLLASGMGVKEAAEALGFANQFHFSRVCRKYAGAPPSALKRKA